MSWCRIGAAVAATLGAASAFVAFGLSSGLRLVFTTSGPRHVAKHSSVGFTASNPGPQSVATQTSVDHESSELASGVTISNPGPRPVATQTSVDHEISASASGSLPSNSVDLVSGSKIAPARQDSIPASQKKHGSHGKVVIVQAKNAVVLNENAASFSMMQASWLQNVAWTKLYAERHGYVHLLYFFGEDFSRACYRVAAETWIRAPWCKVLAVLDAMAEYPDYQYFLWVDTDVWLQRPSLKFSDFVKQVRVGETNLCRAKKETVASSNASVFLWMNARNFFPWNCYPHTGIWLARRSDFARDVLLSWWSLAGLNFTQHIHIQGPCEQGPFVSLVMKKYKEHAVKVQDDPFTPHAPRAKGIAPLKDQFFVHRCRKCIWMIDPSMVLHKIMKENHIDFDRMWKTVAKLSPRRITEDGDILKRLDVQSDMKLSQSAKFSVLYDKISAGKQSPKLAQDFDDEHCSGQSFSKHAIRP